MSTLPRSTSEQPVTPLMRVVFALGAFLVFLIGADLLGFPSHTATLFAWTVEKPITAAFLGTFYWTACVLAGLSFRQASWSAARVGVLGVFAFVLVTLVVSLIHRAALQFTSDEPVARIVSFAWIGVYAVDPLLILAAWITQRHASGSDAVRRSRLPGSFRAVLVAQAAVMMGLGAALLVRADTVGGLWPWAIKGLDAQAIAAWLIGLGLVVGHAAWENAWERISVVLWSAVVLATLQLLVIARFHTALSATPAAFMYVTAVVSLAAVGLYGIAAARRTS